MHSEFNLKNEIKNYYGYMKYMSRDLKVIDR